MPVPIPFTYIRVADTFMDHLVYTPHISTGELINVKYQLRLFILITLFITVT